MQSPCEFLAACPAGFAFALAKRISETTGKKFQCQRSDHKREDEINRLTSEFSLTLITSACPAGFAFALAIIAKCISETTGKRFQCQRSDHKREDEINRLTSEFSLTLIVSACPAGFAFALANALAKRHEILVPA